MSTWGPRSGARQLDVLQTEYLAEGFGHLPDFCASLGSKNCIAGADLAALPCGIAGAHTAREHDVGFIALAGSSRDPRRAFPNPDLVQAIGIAADLYTGTS